MHIDVSYDLDSECVNIIYEHSISLSAYLDSRGKVAYSSSFEQLDDEKVHTALRKICELVLSIT